MTALLTKLQVLLLIFLINCVLIAQSASSTSNDYVASLPTNSCNTSGNFKEINNGCYFFGNSSTMTWSAANSTCHTIGARLLALDLLTESIALSFWLKGFSYTNSYWTDGMYSSSEGGYIWSWSGQSIVDYGYLKIVSSGQSYKYIAPNSSKDYELYDNSGSMVNGYICEAIISCSQSDNVCMNNATCYVNSGRVLCICKPGYTGVLCEIPIDYCLSVPCQHGGNCTTLVNSYSCTCSEFYQGANCETEIAYAYSNARTAALAICISIVGLIIMILCLMDLPWQKIMAVFSSKKSKKEAKENAKNKQIQVETRRKQMSLEEKKRMHAKTSADLINAEEEMLKRFKSALANTRRNTQAQQRNSMQQSPMSRVEINDDPLQRSSVLSFSKP